MKISFYNNDRVYEKYEADIQNMVGKSFRSGQQLEGGSVNQFERSLAKYCGRKYAISVGSCTDALFFSLKSLNLPAKSEVIVTSFSFLASMSAILRANLIPVFIDIDPDTYLMNLEKLDSVYTNKVSAILAVNLFGQCLNVDKLEQFSKDKNIKLIEDNAQSLGSNWRDRKAGSFGEISCLSFDPTKIISAFGSGGAILTDNYYIAEKIKSYRYHNKPDYISPGYNSRISTFQAEILNFQLDKIEDWISKRRYIANKYIKGLKGNKLIEPFKTENNSDHVYHKFVMKFKSKNYRNYIFEALNKKGVDVKIHYNSLLYEYPMVSYKERKCDIADDVRNRVLSIPIYPELSNEEINYIINTINHITKDVK